MIATFRSNQPSSNWIRNDQMLAHHFILWIHKMNITNKQTKKKKEKKKNLNTYSINNINKKETQSKHKK